MVCSCYVSCLRQRSDGPRDRTRKLTVSLTLILTDRCVRFCSRSARIALARTGRHGTTMPTYARSLVAPAHEADYQALLSCFFRPLFPGNEGPL